MLALGNTSTTLEMQAGSDPGANVPVHVTYEDVKYNADKAGERILNHEHSQLASGGTATVTVCSAPEENYTRVIAGIWFRNASASTITYKVRVKDTSETPQEVELRFSLLTGETAVFDGKRWHFYTTAGHEK